jgi:hypothetical protein
VATFTRLKSGSWRVQVRQELMARVTHAAQIDLRFGDPARVFLDFGISVYPGNFACERVHLFGQGWIGINGQAQPLTKRVSNSPVQ